MQVVPFSDCHYLGKNIIDEAWGITITTAGYEEIPPGANYPRREEHPARYYFQSGRILDEYQLVYITKGEGYFNSKNTGKIRIQAGDAFLLFPDEWHDFMPDSETGWVTYWIGFKGSYPDSLYEKRLFQKGSPVYTIGQHEAVVLLFRQVIEYSKSGYPAYHQVIAGAAMHLLAQVHAINLNNKCQDAAEQMIAKAKILIRERIHERCSPEKVAESLNVSYSLFRSSFKQYTGMAPGKYQQQLRIQKAKELLMDVTKTVKEISLILNFESDYYFSTFFKQKTGVAPTAFRKRQLIDA